MFRRETIIALRARHQAFRIAAAILYPILHEPLPPQPAIPPKHRPDQIYNQVLTPEQMRELVREAHRREAIRERLKQLLILGAMTLLLGIMVLMMWPTKP